jgi:phosphocarrier protein HPr
MPKITQEFVIKNTQGLHARPAALFVQIASKYNSSVIVQKGEERVNGKSIMGILTLGAVKGSNLIVEIDGEDAELVLNEIVVLLNKENI